jgi:hypothetical protein
VPDVLLQADTIKLSNKVSVRARVFSMVFPPFLCL